MKDTKKTEEQLIVELAESEEKYRILSLDMNGNISRPGELTFSPKFTMGPKPASVISE